MPPLISVKHFSQSLWQQSAGHSLLSLRGESTWNPLEEGGNTALPLATEGGHHQISMDVINKRNAPSPLASKKETQAFLALVSFWSTHIPNQCDHKTSLASDPEEK